MIEFFLNNKKVKAKDDETIWTMDLTCSRFRTLPSASFTKTEAVGDAEFLTKTDLSGIAKCTLAPKM